jgi:hypothetical protein
MKPIHHALSLLFVRPIALLMGSVPIRATIDYFTHSTLAGASAAMKHDPAVASEQLALHYQVTRP